MNNRMQAIASLAEAYQLDAIYAFGSKAEEILCFPSGTIEQPEVSSPSDADIAVLPRLGCRLSVRDKALLAAKLEDLLLVNRVDLVVLPDADPFLAVNAIRGELIYRRDKDRADEYELYLLRRAGDLAHLERERMALILDDT